MKFSVIDYEMMALALKEANKGLYTTDPNPRVGCVLVKNGQVVGTGWHRQAGEAHAEVNAIHSAGPHAFGADCYVTLEPCSHEGRTGPCAEALIKAGVSRVVLAVRDPNPLVSGRGMAMLRRAGIAIEAGCLQSQAELINAGYFKRMRTGLPLVRVKMAISLDGRTALANGVSKWITGSEARLDVQRLRARSSVVLTGSGTLAADNPRLTVRSENFDGISQDNLRQPVRAVIDGSGISNPAHLLFSSGRAETKRDSILVFTSPKTYQKLRGKKFPQGVQILEMPINNTGRIDLQTVLATLGKLECNELLVEAGSTLAGAFIGVNLVDELWVYQAPRVIGNYGRGAFLLPEYKKLDEPPKSRLVELRQIGADIRIILNMEK